MKTINMSAMGVESWIKSKNQPIMNDIGKEVDSGKLTEKEQITEVIIERIFLLRFRKF